MEVLPSAAMFVTESEKSSHFTSIIIHKNGTSTLLMCCFVGYGNVVLKKALCFRRFMASDRISAEDKPLVFPSSLLLLLYLGL
jgi:hypothetical protein